MSGAYQKQVKSKFRESADLKPELVGFSNVITLDVLEAVYPPIILHMSFYDCIMIV